MCQDQHWTHDADTPHRAATNGIAERAAAKPMVKVDFPKNGGTVRRSVIATLRNVQDRMAGGKTAYERRCGGHVEGPSIPRGAKVSSKPTS